MLGKGAGLAVSEKMAGIAGGRPRMRGEGKVSGPKNRRSAQKCTITDSNKVWSLHLQETKPSPIVCFKPDKGGKGLFNGCHELWSVGPSHVYLMSAS